MHWRGRVRQLIITILADYDRFAFNWPIPNRRGGGVSVSACFSLHLCHSVADNLVNSPSLIDDPEILRNLVCTLNLDEERDHVTSYILSFRWRHGPFGRGPRSRTRPRPASASASAAVERLLRPRECRRR